MLGGLGAAPALTASTALYLDAAERVARLKLTNGAVDDEINRESQKWRMKSDGRVKKDGELRRRGLERKLVRAFAMLCGDTASKDAKDASDDAAAPAAAALSQLTEKAVLHWLHKFKENGFVTSRMFMDVPPSEVEVDGLVVPEPTGKHFGIAREMAEQVFRGLRPAEKQAMSPSHYKDISGLAEAEEGVSLRGKLSVEHARHAVFPPRPNTHTPPHRVLERGRAVLRDCPQLGIQSD